PLRGKRGERHAISFVSKGRKRRVVLSNALEARGWPHTYNMPPGLVRTGTALHHAKLPGGAGYMYVRRLDGSVTDGIARALEAHPDAKGWIVDLRGNGGGGYDAALIAKVSALPRPVACLIDAGCISAGETFARELARYAGARLIGSPTAGASSSKSVWRFPSGVAAVTFPTRSRWRSDGKPIEFNGIEPDIIVEADPEEVAGGENSAIRRAEEYLVAQAKRLAALPRRESWRAGDRALVDWTGDAYWYRAEVVRPEGGGYLVRYGDGTEERVELARMIEDDIKAGDPVSGRWKRGRRWFPGRVTKRDGDAIHVVYDDGDEEDTTVDFVRVVRPRPED
ncbi:MAG: S41 family peptidase, partial [Planctomycetota bacterium]